MKLLWKGKMTKDNVFSYPDIPQSAKPLFSGNNAWLTYVLIIPVLALAYLGIQIRRPFVTGMMFSKYGLLIGVAVSVFFLVIHELIHAVCCPTKAVVEIYFTAAGISAVPTCPMSKKRYLLVALMPTIVLAMLPFILWLCVPDMNVIIGSIIYGFAIGSLSMCIGDMYNVILVLLKMPSSAVLVVSNNNAFYFDPTK